MASQTPVSPYSDGSPRSQISGRESPRRRQALPSIHSLLGPAYIPPCPPSDFFPTSASRSTSSQNSPDFIDLTNDSDPPTSPMPPLERRTSREPARKRRRLTETGGNEAGSSQTRNAEPAVLTVVETPDDQREASPRSTDDSDEIEEVDLSHVQSDMELRVHQAQQRRRHMEMQEQQNQLLKDSVAAQQEDSSGPTNLSKLSCIICMESMTDMTATHCGHVFCHTCIMEALIAGERQGHEPGKGLSRCPVCRKKVSRPQGKPKEPQQVIPLEIKFIRRSEKSKGKQREPALEGVP